MTQVSLIYLLSKGFFMRSKFVAITVAATSCGALAVAPSAQAESFDYVAMGDSYSAGSGVLPLSSTPNAVPCTRSAENYAGDLTAQHGYHLTDVTCGAATTADFVGKQFGVIPGQANALSEKTDLVTMTIGGNDEGLFLSLISACGSAGSVSFGAGTPCRTIYGNTFDAKLPKIYDNLVTTFSLVKAKAPNARVAAAGYPHIVPESGPARACYLTMPIAAGDYPYVTEIETKLNATIARAAAVTGVTYVDVWGASAGHDSCQKVGQRWVEPALWGTNYVPVHPNGLGEQAYARAFGQTLGL